MKARVVGAARIILICIGYLMIVQASAWATTLETVRERGFLICGANAALPGFSEQDANGRWSGFDVDLCRGIAAAIFGNPDMIEFRPLPGESRFAPLQTGDIDVMTRDGPWTQKRDSVFGVRYVTTSFFDGQAFMVPQSLGAVSAYELDNISICVLDGGDEQSQLQDFFFSNQASYTEILYEDVADLGVAYRAGLCKGVSAPARQLQVVRRSLPDPANHRILPERISKELLGPVVRVDDDQWFKIVQWTVFALINAEEVGITSLNIDSLSAARTQGVRRILGTEGDYGKPLGLSATFMKDAIRAVGNYGELYDRNFGPQTGAALLRGQNALWSNGGQMYAPPIR
ncbi:transporter substrate-binding domain-containing protein [Devosia rhodophyticola]|uniref:Transporter substrate-binding domain-containing protein n=1 Tax=Devosia rhodophyticola TaxID=3026423 RepID=A0ABY7YWG9_9HYPH|nr:transporter substrate-binding domain-containing protein [Devosia rhodophyticola]WDR05581.1 transporter substrate-binding domain-containing protein [Devosia rhodophyticola]